MSEPIKKVTQLPIHFKVALFGMIMILLLVIFFPYFPLATYPLESGIETDRISVSFSTDIQPTRWSMNILQEATHVEIGGKTYQGQPRITEGIYIYPPETVTLMLHLDIVFKTIATEDFEIDWQCVSPLRKVIFRQTYPKDPTKTEEVVAVSYEIDRSLGTWIFMLQVWGEYDETVYQRVYYERWDVIINWGTLLVEPTTEPATTEPTTTEETIPEVTRTEEEAGVAGLPVSDINGLFVIAILTTMVIIRRVRK